MFVNKRSDSILEYLKEHKKATIEELGKTLYASESTIRRDLNEMQTSGLIARYHGGAMLLEDTNEISLFVRNEQNIRDKEQCAMIALGRIPKFNTVFIDNSSTCLALAKKMDFTNKTVITNGLQIALQLSGKRNIQLIVPGGNVQVNTGAIMGSVAVDFLKQFNIDLMLSSCAAFNESEVYELSLETAQFKKTVMSRCKQHLLIADKSKVCHDAPYKSVSTEKFEIIVTNADEHALRPLRERNLQVYNK